MGGSRIQALEYLETAAVDRISFMATNIGDVDGMGIPFTRKGARNLIKIFLSTMISLTCYGRE
jgi:hypothetical protein